MTVAMDKAEMIEVTMAKNDDFFVKKNPWSEIKDRQGKIR
jgi:hypothetical protein